MGELIKPNDISEDDYRAIEEAVMETARGRWFLAEYAKRNRESDTVRVVEAIDNLKSYISSEHDPADMLQLRLDIVDMTQTIEQIKTEVANTGDNGTTISDAQVELNVVLDETEDATSNILSSAEKIQEIIWELKETDKDNSQFDKIDELVTDVYMACSFQDLTGQRLRKVVGLTSDIEQRLKNMVSLWDADELHRYKQSDAASHEDEHLKNGPALPTDAQEQNEIDAVLSAEDVEFEAALDWSDPDNEAVSDEDAFFVIDDSFEEAPDPNMMAFEADTEDELAFQAPPAEEVMDDDDEWEVNPASLPETQEQASADVQDADEEIGVAPLHARLAQFS
ncbi:MAG: protein phosphatase CheZ [Hyphomicrobiales bacterium]